MQRLIRQLPPNGSAAPTSSASANESARFQSSR
jgi:hypothetical protein